MILINLLGIISTLSRGGFLILIFMSILIFWEQRHRFHPRYLGPVMAVLCAAMIFAVLTTPRSFIVRQETIAKGTQADKSTRRRADYINVGWDSFTKNPLLGKGTDTFKNVWHDSLTCRIYGLPSYRTAHNTYIEVLVGSGLIGLILFLLILGRASLNYTQAIKGFQQAGEEELVSLTRAYRLSFISICTYFLILSAIEHKLLLLALAISQTAFGISQNKEYY